jgi:hypothetical protein
MCAAFSGPFKVSKALPESGRIDRHQKWPTHFDLLTRPAFPSSVGFGEIGCAFNWVQDANESSAR